MPFRSAPEVLPRLTARKTAEVIAKEHGGDPSKILVRLDKERTKRLGKRARKAGRNSFGTLENAVESAMSSLGVARVASILKVNEWSLRKAVDPDQPERRLPDFGIRDLLRLIHVLHEEGHPEHFSVALGEAGVAAQAVEHLPTVHHAVTLSCLTHGEIARTIAEAANDGEITMAEASAILDAIGRHEDATRLLRDQVLACAKPKGKAS